MAQRRSWTYIQYRHCRGLKADCHTVTHQEEVAQRQSWTYSTGTAEGLRLIVMESFTRKMWRKVKAGPTVQALPRA